MVVGTDDLAWTYCFHHLMAHVDRPKMLLQNIHNHLCTRLYCILTQTTLWIFTTVSTSNPLPKIIQNWNIHGKVTMGKLNYRKAVCVCILLLFPFTASLDHFSQSFSGHLHLQRVFFPNGPITPHSFQSHPSFLLCKYPFHCMSFVYFLFKSYFWIFQLP